MQALVYWGGRLRCTPCGRNCRWALPWHGPSLWAAQHCLRSCREHRLETHTCWIQVPRLLLLLIPWNWTSSVIFLSFTFYLCKMKNTPTHPLHCVRCHVVSCVYSLTWKQVSTLFIHKLHLMSWKQESRIFWESQAHTKWTTWTLPT